MAADMVIRFWIRIAVLQFRASGKRRSAFDRPPVGGAARVAVEGQRRISTRSALRDGGIADQDERLNCGRPAWVMAAAASARMIGCGRVPSPASSGWNRVARKNGC